MHPEHENRYFRETADYQSISFGFLLTSVRTFQIVVNGCLLAPGAEIRKGWWGDGWWRNSETELCSVGKAGAKGHLFNFY